MKKVRAVIRAIHPDVKTIETSHGDVPVKDIMETNSFDFSAVMRNAGWCRRLVAEEEKSGKEHVHKAAGDTGRDEDEYGISTMVYYRRIPFDRQLIDSFADHWPSNIIRSKGIMWLADDPDTAWVFESSGSQVQATYSGHWIASLPAAERARYLDETPSLTNRWDKKVGDRMIKLCIIGQNIDKERFSAQLDNCLETDP
jgi:G3E family GTPase